MAIRAKAVCVCTRGDSIFEAMWMPLSDFAPGGPPLYPEGVYELVATRLARRQTE